MIISSQKNIGMLRRKGLYITIVTILLDACISPDIIAFKPDRTNNLRRNKSITSKGHFGTDCGGSYVH